MVQNENKQIKKVLLLIVFILIITNINAQEKSYGFTLGSIYYASANSGGAYLLNANDPSINYNLGGFFEYGIS